MEKNVIADLTGQEAQDFLKSIHAVTKNLMHEFNPWAMRRWINNELLLKETMREILISRGAALDCGFPILTIDPLASLPYIEAYTKSQQLTLEPVQHLHILLQFHHFGCKRFGIRRRILRIRLPHPSSFSLEMVKFRDEREMLNRLLESDMDYVTGTIEFKLVPFAKQGEITIPGAMLLERAHELNAYCGQRHGEALLANQLVIPWEWRHYDIYLPGIIFKNKFEHDEILLLRTFGQSGWGITSWQVRGHFLAHYRLLRAMRIS